MSPTGPIICASCGYITSDTVSTCPRCSGPMPRDESPYPPASDLYEGAGHDTLPPARPPLPHERGHGHAVPYEPVARPRRKGGGGILVFLVAIAGLVVVGIVAFALGVVPRLVSGISGIVEDVKVKEELARVLSSQPNLSAACSAVEGTLTYEGMMYRRGEDIAFEILYPRSLVLDDRSRQGMTTIAVIIPESGPAKVVVPEVMSFTTLRRGGSDYPDNWYRSLETILAEPDCSARLAGTETVGGVDCRIYELSHRARPGSLARVYVAENLKDLILAVDLPREWTKVGRLRLTLRDPAFTVDDDKFRVPVTYTELRAPSGR